MKRICEGCHQVIEQGKTPDYQYKKKRWHQQCWRNKYGHNVVRKNL